MPATTLASSAFDANELVYTTGKQGQPAIMTAGGPRSDPNASIQIKPKGTGTIQITALQATTFGANGKTPQCAAVITGSRSSPTAIVMSNLLTALAAAGLIVDNTTV
jgi:hypothetical protein